MNLTSKPKESSNRSSSDKPRIWYLRFDEAVCGRANLYSILGTKSNERNGSTSALCCFILFCKKLMLFFIILSVSLTYTLGSIFECLCVSVFVFPSKFTLRISRYFREFFNAFYISFYRHAYMLRLRMIFRFFVIGFWLFKSVITAFSILSPEWIDNSWNKSAPFRTLDSILFQICKNYIHKWLISDIRGWQWMGICMRTVLIWFLIWWFCHFGSCS